VLIFVIWPTNITQSDVEVVTALLSAGLVAKNPS
jgi:hypothetical protein